MADSIVPFEPSLPGDNVAPPPLRIHHLLVATTVVAVLLSINDVLRRNDVMGVSQFITSAHGVLYTIVTALSATLVAFGFWWRHKGQTFFHLPGHWLLLVQSLGVSVFAAAAMSVAIRMAGGGDAYYRVPFLAYMILATIAKIVLSFWAAWKIADSFSWRLWFVGYGCQMPAIVIQGKLGGAFLYFVAAMPAGLFLLLIVAAISDWAAHRTRDWPHWLGVVLQLILFCAWFARAVLGQAN
jgi:hypothetical protein